MTSSEYVNWIENVLVYRIKDKHSDLKDASIENCSVEALEVMKDNWASMMFEVNLTLVNNTERKSLFLLVKLEHEDENVRKIMKSEDQFFNESYFYSDAFPSLISSVCNMKLKSDLENFVPKCYYSHISKGKEHVSPTDGILVMENLKMKDYKLGNRTFLDLQHCILAVQRIGMFHALSYLLKERDPEALKKTVKPIIETNYPISERKIINTLFGVTQLRVLNALEAKLSKNDPRLARLRATSKREAFDVYVDLVIPREPLAVLCHGDFLRNNVLFQYQNGVPVDMKLVDFQTIRYASPAIDLSLFICMNTSHELRSEHFPCIIREYHDSVRRTLAALLEVDVEQLPSQYHFDAFLQDFRQHALYGYLITTDFMPCMMASEEELLEINHYSFQEKGSPKHLECAIKLGGSKATQALVDLAEDLISFECL